MPHQRLPVARIGSHQPVHPTDAQPHCGRLDAVRGYPLATLIKVLWEISLSYRIPDEDKPDELEIMTYECSIVREESDD